MNVLQWLTMLNPPACGRSSYVRRRQSLVVLLTDRGKTMCATSIYHSSASHVKPRRRANLPLLPSPTGGQPANKCTPPPPKKKKTFEQYEASRRILTWSLINKYCFPTDVPLLFFAQVYVQFHIWSGRMTVKDEPRGKKRRWKTFDSIYSIQNVKGCNSYKHSSKAEFVLLQIRL